MTPKKPSTGRLLLAVHTATPYQGVALLEEGGLLGESLWLAGESGGLRRPYLPILAAEVEALLKRLGAQWREVAAIGLTHGPGSFTGVRSGLAFAKGLGFALGVPLVAVGTLEALACQVGQGLVAPLLDARRGELYWGLFRVVEGAVETIIPPQAATPEKICETLAAYSEPVALTGEPLGWIPFAGFYRAPPDAWALRPGSLGRLTWEGFLQGGGRPASQVLPFYLRSPL
ncbi:MAG: tRNA (adenosine(37)-N6)-threonylcarbamoyltransferase complex dimerization subunit type 1 TsaB [bacterium]